MPLRLKRFAGTVYTDKSGSNTSRVPVNGATVDVYRQGATAETGATVMASGGTGVFTVRDLGRIRNGDTIFRLDPNTDTLVQLLITSITGAAGRDLNVTNNTLSSITVAIGDRWSDLSPKPNIYAENTGASTPIASSQVTTDANGEYQFFADEQAVDRIVAGGSPAVATFGKWDDGGEAGGTKTVSNEPESSTTTSIAHILDTVDTFSTAGGLLLRILMAGVEKWKVDLDGKVTQQSNLTVIANGITVTGNSTIVGTLTGLTGLTVGGLVTITTGGLAVTGATTITGVLTVTDDLLLGDRLQLTQIVEPATPAATKHEVYVDSTSTSMFVKGSGGTPKQLDFVPAMLEGVGSSDFPIPVAQTAVPGAVVIPVYISPGSQFSQVVGHCTVERVIDTGGGANVTIELFNATTAVVIATQTKLSPAGVGMKTNFSLEAAIDMEQVSETIQIRAGTADVASRNEIKSTTGTDAEKARITSFVFTKPA